LFEGLFQFPEKIIDDFRLPAYRHILTLQHMISPTMIAIILAIVADDELSYQILTTLVFLACRPGAVSFCKYGFDPAIALLRAVTELNQMVSQLPLDLNAWPANTPVEKNMKSWCTSAMIEEQPYLAPDASQPLRVRQSYSRLWSDDLREDILTGVDILQRHNIEVLVLDQTRPDVGLKVVKVIAPGMRHFWARLAPGRLYDVPVRLGWLPVALREEQLNSTPIRNAAWGPLCL